MNPPRVSRPSGPLVLLALLWPGFGLSTPPVLDAPPATPRGAELARTICTACHLYPDPDLHDVATWRSQVLPLMHRNAGIAEIRADGSPEEKAALEQWRSIWEFYFQTAPAHALPQAPRPSIRPDLGRFTVENPRYRQGISYATLVQIDPETRQIYVGNAFTRSLDVLDQRGRGLATTKLDTTLTHLRRTPQGWLATQIGMVVPDDRPLGRVTRIERPGLRFEVKDDVLTGLVRPIECAVGDLNGDQRPDLVVCSYGNRTGVSGKLAWYEHRGGTNYEEHVLLDRPGATRCFVLDADRDGRLDIIALMAQAKEGVYLFRNDGGGEFTETPLVIESPAWGGVHLELADFNRDGHLDLLTANGDLGDFECPPKRYHGVRIYLNDGAFKFREVFCFPLNGAYKAVARDFDQDGDLDIAAISFFPDYERSPEESFVYLENRGTLEFAAHTFPDCERGRWLTMDAGDLDADGDTDIVLGAAFKTPFRAPESLKQRWEKEGPSLLILRNTTKPSGLGARAADPPTPSGWQAAPGYRVRALTIPTGGRPAGFTLLTPEQSGVWFTNVLTPPKAAENQIRLNGSGVALGDVDGDGWCDIYLCGLESANTLYRNLGNGRFTNITTTAGVACGGQYSSGAVFADLEGDGDLDLLVNGIGAGTRLFLNDGRAVFSERTDAGLVRTYGATTAALADTDGDGDLDLYVANYRTTTVRSTGFALLNVGGKRMIRPEDRDRLEITPEGRVLEHGEPHFLYRNEGAGRFRIVSWTDGSFLDETGQALPRAPRDWGLSAMFRDLNADGAPDLYVCNDFHSTDKVWINQGQGRFRLIEPLALRNSATFSMAVDFADVNRDGFDDILVSDMMSRQHGRRLMQEAGMEPYPVRVGVFDDRQQFDRTVLQLNRGDGTYAEAAYDAGVQASEWTWAVVFLDVDLDGFEDILCTTGHMFDTQDLDAQARIAAQGPWPREKVPGKLLLLPPLSQPNLAFRNLGTHRGDPDPPGDHEPDFAAGAQDSARGAPPDARIGSGGPQRTAVPIPRPMRSVRFTETGVAWGFDAVGVSQGIALADLDQDGDLDAVVNNLNGAAAVYRNDATAPRVAVRLRGQPPNTQGIGAKLRLLGGAVPLQTQEVLCGGRYLSGDDATRTFAAGSLTGIMRLEVLWRSGQRSVIDGIRPNHAYEVLEPAAPAPPPPPRPQPEAPFFEDVSPLIAHRHVETPFDDFARQPLLPNRLSQLGPGVGWHDLDDDGWEDLMVAGGRGGELAIFRNDGRGGFNPLVPTSPRQPLLQDQTTVLGWRAGTNTARLLVGHSSYEIEGTPRSGVTGLDPWGLQPPEDLPPDASSTGPLALADYDGDGELDLFVGGRLIPGRYPAAARSRLFRGKAGRWVLDAAQSTVLRGAGLVSGAVWSDLTGDGWPDLALACEWGPVRLFRNDRGTLNAWDAPLEASPVGPQPTTLSQLTGWWAGITTGDLDGDGRLDLIVSNWGLNTKYQASPEAPRRLYYGDWGGSGAMDLLEAFSDPVRRVDVPERDRDAVAASIPAVAARFPTHREYALAGVREVLGEFAAATDRLDATTLASTVFFNRGDRYAAVPMPFEAQIAPAFGVTVADFDGDGAEDLFLSQNFFAMQPKTSRADAGRGLWLRGDGRGGLVAVPGQVSGIKVYGEQRGCAVADYDADGRIDVVVAQNGNATKLYRNRRGSPGLRVRLLGQPGNPTAVGAVLRIGVPGSWGPAREIHAGSGYWSEDGAVQVLAWASAPGTPATAVHVRWPGGHETTSEIPRGAREITITPDGAIRRRPTAKSSSGQEEGALSAAHDPAPQAAPALAGARPSPTHPAIDP